VRQLVTQALIQQAAPDARTAALIALLHALKCEHKIIDPRPYQLSRQQLRARAEEIAMDNWASEAVRKVIAEMVAATATAAAAAASSGSPHERTGPPAARTAPHGGVPVNWRRRGHRDTTRNALARHALIARPCGRHPDIGLPNVQEPCGATAAP
jgi:hypothetical protein